MKERRIVALLGRRDAPSDAVEEYCRYLGGALRAHGIEMELERVPWAERGWPAALRELRQKAATWRGEWVLAQYTALAWSARGFPLKFLQVMDTLRGAGARVAVVLHDMEPYGGNRVVDAMRRRSQLHTMRRSLQRADLAIFTVAFDAVSWLGNPPAKALFISVGANLPWASAPGLSESTAREQSVLRVAVFGITGGETGRRESARIAEALRFAAERVGQLQFHAFGRIASDFESELCEGLRGAAVKVQVEGMLPPERVVEALRSADVMLFVRGAISSRRGSAIAGIACGLPVIAYGGRETAAPITEAGVVLVSQERRTELGEALVHVLRDREYRAALAEKSRAAHAQYFSWDAIAARYAGALSK
jgi:glycosyltransferase involved in cell wall biosynthesis